MERYIRIGTLFAGITLACLLSIITTNGELGWGTFWSVVFILLLAAVGYTGFLVAHTKFKHRWQEIAVGVALVVGLVLVVVIAAIAGAMIFQLIKDALAGATLLWLIWPVLVTAALTWMFGLYKMPQQRPTVVPRTTRRTAS